MSTEWQCCSPHAALPTLGWASMKVLIAGGGGREHALACKCAASDRVAEVWVAPGNAGTAGEPKVRNVSVAAEDVAELLALARSERSEERRVGKGGRCGG